ncbi:cytoplasmic tRNA 2-thiolation protein 2 [Nelusetta ayraudi]|uniref:cytoplasmic tRNA 2-thiolation protein 2 n=1 Tax=Nelusetta ayraudi TaxID=303726 RepID=UPI003F710F60
MCQVDEHYQEPLEESTVPSVSKKCVKCKEATAAVVIRAGDTYCRRCFKEYFIHKFRAMLGKNRIIFPGEKVLLAVSGGPSSCSMLSQVQEGLSEAAHKKLRFSPGIVFIDEGGAVGQCAEDRRAKVAELQTVFRRTGFPFHILPLEQVLDLSSAAMTTVPPPPERPAGAYKAAVDDFIQNAGSSGSALDAVEAEETSAPAAVGEGETQALQQLMASAKTQTAREDLLSTLRQHLLVQVARTKGYTKVMLGDNCTRIAVKLLTSISLGRGAHLAQDTAFSDSRFGDVVLVRPMRDYSAKEVAYYNHMFKVPSVFMAGLDTKSTEKASIQRLTESFVTKLQADFPSTVSTIYRTSEKLQVACKSSSGADRSGTCLFCRCPLDTAVGEASAFKATLVSQQLSQANCSGAQEALQSSAARCPSTGPPAPASSTQQCCSPDGAEGCGGAAGTAGCCSSAKAAEKMDLRPLLCYSCQLTVKDMSSLEQLPPYILSEAQRSIRRSKMREELTDFLLDDGDED